MVEGDGGEVADPAEETDENEDEGEVAAEKRVVMVAVVDVEEAGVSCTVGQLDILDTGETDSSPLLLLSSSSSSSWSW